MKLKHKALIGAGVVAGAGAIWVFSNFEFADFRPPKGRATLDEVISVPAGLRENISEPLLEQYKATTNPNPTYESPDSFSPPKISLEKYITEKYDGKTIGDLSLSELANALIGYRDKELRNCAGLSNLGEYYCKGFQTDIELIWSYLDNNKPVFERDLLGNWSPLFLILNNLGEIGANPLHVSDFASSILESFSSETFIKGMLDKGDSDYYEEYATCVLNLGYLLLNTPSGREIGILRNIVDRVDQYATPEQRDTFELYLKIVRDNVKPK